MGSVVLPGSAAQSHSPVDRQMGGQGWTIPSLGEGKASVLLGGSAAQPHLPFARQMRGQGWLTADLCLMSVFV